MRCAERLFNEFVTLAGLGLMGLSSYLYYKNEGHKKRYRFFYTGKDLYCNNVT